MGPHNRWSDLLKRIAEALGYVVPLLVVFVAAIAAIATIPHHRGLATWLYVALGVAVVALGAIGAIAAVQLHREDERELAELEREQMSAEAERVARLRVAPIRRVKDVTPYDVGVDPEAPQAQEEAGEGGHPTYLERDRDADVRAAIADALAAGQPRMVVLSGGSKAGKSRTLFQAAQSVVGDHLLIAPKRGPSNLSELVGQDGLPELPPGAAVLWLDDLEDFVGADDGIRPSMLERELPDWGRDVVVLATEGGKGLARRSEGERGRA